MPRMRPVPLYVYDLEQRSFDEDEEQILACRKNVNCDLR